MRIPIDIVGDIAILKFSKYAPYFYKKFYALKLLKQISHIKVVLEKTKGFSGNLRIQETRHLAGEPRKDTIHRENDCSFYLNVDETYFSPRLSEDRKIMCEEVLKSIKSNSSVLVMFSGISPFPIVLSKTLKKNKINAKIISSELNKKACEYGEKNIRINKVTDYVEIICGDSKKLCEKFSKQKKKFDFIFMLRPNLEDTFLDSAFKVAKKGTTIYYHGFCENEKQVSEEILKDANKSKRKISKLQIRKAGDISVKKNRYNVKFQVL